MFFQEEFREVTFNLFIFLMWHVWEMYVPFNRRDVVSSSVGGRIVLSPENRDSSAQQWIFHHNTLCLRSQTALCIERTPAGTVVLGRRNVC